LEKRSEQPTCLFQSQFERPSRHDAPCSSPTGTLSDTQAAGTTLAEYAKTFCIDPSVELLRGFGALVDRAHRCLILTRMFIVSVIVVISGATRRVCGENQSLKLARGV